MSELHYQLIGQSNARTVVFLHGFLGDCDDWQPVADVLKRSYQCLTLDLPGHGKSCALDSDEFSMERTAQAVVSVLDSLSIDRCDLIGYSMGGRLAYYLLIHHPERFDRAVIESATPGLESELQKVERVKADEALALRLESLDSQSAFEQFLAEWYAQPLFRSLTAEPCRLTATIDRRKANSPHQLAQSLRLMGTGCMPNLWDKLDRITASLLLIAGEKDDKFRAIVSRASTMCQSSKLAIVEDAGHNVHLEKPESYLKLVSGFLGIERQGKI